MTNSPVDLTISHIKNGPVEFLRIQCKDGLKPVVILDMSASDFLNAIMGAEIIAAYSDGRAK